MVFTYVNVHNVVISFSVFIVKRGRKQQIKQNQRQAHSIHILHFASSKEQCEFQPRSEGGK